MAVQDRLAIDLAYSYCVMDDVFVSIAISITELYGQLSGTLYYKSSEAVWKQHYVHLAVYDTGVSIAN